MFTNKSQASYLKAAGWRPLGAACWRRLSTKAVTEPGTPATPSDNGIERRAHAGFFADPAIVRGLARHAKQAPDHALWPGVAEKLGSLPRKRAKMAGSDSGTIAAEAHDVAIAGAERR
jgi:hypothetical protein